MEGEASMGAAAAATVGATARRCAGTAKCETATTRSACRRGGRGRDPSMGDAVRVDRGPASAHAAPPAGKGVMCLVVDLVHGRG